ncbi:MAG: WbqC family protein [Gemmatimonadota bacterium]|nr:WbqC family protein [Gemmatimonadota bacterium]
MVPGKSAAIVQSNYIPWKGYFDLIARVDEFVLYDDMQYTRRDWRNRNRIKTLQGVHWLTIPVEVKGKYFQRIRDTVVSDERWAREHWQTLQHSYRRAPHFAGYRDRLADIYERAQSLGLLSEINHLFLSAVCEMLAIPTRITWSSDYRLTEDRTERLVDICRQVGATEYVSGPAARAYMDETRFATAGITLTYMDYSGYPEYPQLHPPFEHGVTALDLLFNTGANAPTYMSYVGR